jgi:hypothetical protein
VASLAAVVAAQAPVILVWVGLWFLGALLGAGAQVVNLALLPGALAAAAVLSMPAGSAGRRAVTAVVGAAALGASLTRSWTGIAIAWLLLVAASTVGGIDTRRITATRRSVATGGWLPLVVNSRALGFRVAPAFLIAAMPLAAGFAFVTNNPDVTGGFAVRWAGALSVVLLYADLVERMARRRPPWRWSRSLPWSSLDRVRTDAVWLGLHSVPFVLVTLWIDFVAGALVLCCLPLLSIRAATALRTRPSRMGVAGPTLVEGLFTATFLAVVPWVGLAALALAWPAARVAAARDRDVGAHAVAARHPRLW